eukprot:m51a1_g2793 hypothetical protein (384) ;mRNA; r:64077-65518
MAAPAAPTAAPPALSFDGQLFLAPMVRVCSLPFRVLARRHGAHACWTDEIIDHKLVACRRVENAALGTTDLVYDKDGTVALRTCPRDRPLIVQLGTASPELALEAAKKIEDVVDAIDVNMGCPVHFSTQGGMGIALMRTPQKAADIVAALSRGLRVPVTAKIRLLATPQETADFVASLRSAGAAAVTIHARRAKEGPRDPPRWAELAEVARIVAAAGGPPLIANGGVERFEDIAEIRRQTGISSVMIGRAAMKNVGVFTGPALPTVTVVNEFLRLCVETDTSLGLSKYPVLQMTLELPKSTRRARQMEVEATRTLPDLCAIWEREAQTASEGDGGKPADEATAGSPQDAQDAPAEQPAAAEEEGSQACCCDVAPEPAMKKSRC